MSIKRNKSPRIQRRRKKEVFMNTIIPFSIPKVSRNEDLFNFTFDKGGLLTSINFNVDYILEQFIPSINVILSYKNIRTNMTFLVEQGRNEFKIDKFFKKDEKLVLDFNSIDSVYKNISGISGTINVRV